MVIRDGVLSGGQECLRFRSDLSPILKHTDVTESHPWIQLVKSGYTEFDDTVLWWDLGLGDDLRSDRTPGYW